MKKVNQIRGGSKRRTRSAISFLIVAVMVLSGVFSLVSSSYAATPPTGVLLPDGPNVMWLGDKTGGAAPNGEADCATIPNVCDEFTLTLGGTVADWTDKRARVQINWRLPATDYDMYIYKDSTSGTQVGSSAAGTSTFEQFDINPASTGVGVYVVRVVYFAATAADQYNGIAASISLPPAFVPPASACQLPSYSRHNPPTTMRGYDGAGEPSVGINWNTGNVMFLSYTNLLRATFNDSTSPATTIWKSTQPTGPISLDPIMFTDSSTGRTIPGQLVVAGGTSVSAITDNDGETFTNNASSGVTSGVDHQGIGAGPYNRNPVAAALVPGAPPVPVVPAVPTTSYPNAWYYSSQNIGYATTARSDDGGLSYGGAVPMYTLAQCSGLHGHPKVAPDGTVYVPNKNCPDPDMNAATPDGGQGVAVSEDNGNTWTVRTLPGSGSGDNDPAVGIGAGGRIFFVYTGGDKHIRAAVSDDKGRTWKFDQDLGLSRSTPTGSAYNIRASVFPAAVAGDNNRAALFFHGTDSMGPGDATGTDGEDTTAGDTRDDFKGTWYPYVATTCNGGMSYSVVRADDPVQQGVICTNGTTCPDGTRNLLDFMDIQVDRFGRAVPGYADGCVTANCLGAAENSVTRTTNDGKDVATILRQLGGSRLFADFDSGGPVAPALPPPVEVKANARGDMELSWKTPDNGGSPLTSYRIYRGIGENEASFVGEVKAGTQSFRDRKSKLRENVYYQVTALNAFGESPRTIKFRAEDSSKNVRAE